MTTDKQITVPKKKKTTTVKSKPTNGEKAKAKPKSKPKPDPKVTVEKTASNKIKTNQEKIEKKTKSTKPKKQKVIPILIEYIFPKMEKYVDPVEDIIKIINEKNKTRDIIY